MRLDISETASDDLNEIGAYLAENAGLRISEEQTDRIVERLAGLLDFPRTGTARPDLGGDRRMVTDRPYVIIYRIVGETVRVLRIVHGARDLPSLLRDTPD